MKTGRRKIEFSIVIPLYNKEKSIRSTINSVLDQSYPNFELIIVNDGSTDDSFRIARAFKDERIRFFNKPNGGVSSARNRGIIEAKYEFISFLDADDIWYPNCLNEFCELIVNFPKATVFATNYNISGKNLKGSQVRYYVDDFYYRSSVLMARWNVPLMITGGVALHKHCFDLVGKYDENINHGEDIDLWMRLAGNCTIAKSEVITTLYRQNAENRASNIPENKKTFPIQVQINKNQIVSKSMQLYYGCQLLTTTFANIKQFKNIKTSLQNLKYSDWMIRAAILYSKYRLFYFDKNKAGGKTFLF